MRKLLRGLLFSAALALTTGFFTVDGARNAHAVPAEINLGFIMDRSGSVGSTNFNLAMSSLATALANNIPIGDPNFIYRIGVVTFASSASSVFNTAAPAPTTVLVDSAAALATVVAGINGAGFTGGSTCYECGFDTLRAAFGGDIGGEIGIINMMTDGASNVGTDITGTTGRNELITAGWDSLSFEAVDIFGSGPDTGALAMLGFANGGVTGGLSIISDPNDISDPLNNPFVLVLNNFGDDYAAAVNAKLQAIINPIPLPGAFPLFAAGLGLMGFMGWRRKRLAAA